MNLVLLGSITRHVIVASGRVIRHRQMLVIRRIEAMTVHPALVNHKSMRTARDQSGPGRTDTFSWVMAIILDELVDGYVDWRESARAVADAYARWSCAPGPERTLRFAAYNAALDREQKTAEAYADAVADVERWLQRSECHRRF
jgi:hypothetical protein